MSSRSDMSASPCLLEIFPFPIEVLHRIYLYSENPALALVNKQFSQCLSSQFIRLQLCVRLFSYGFGPSLSQNTGPAEILGRAQTLVFQQPWFLNKFAREVQRELLRLWKVQMGVVDLPKHCPYGHVRAAFLTKIPRQLLLQKPWSAAKVKLIHRLLKWGAQIPTRPEHIRFDAMMNVIIEQKYLAVNLLYNYGHVQFHHKHFQAAVLHGCNKRIVEMIVESNNQQHAPFIDPFDEIIYNQAMLMWSAGDPMGRQLLTDVLWKGNKRGLTVATRRP